MYTYTYINIHVLIIHIQIYTGNNESTEPFTSNMYNRRVLAGEFTIVNKYLLKDLVERGVWTPEVIICVFYIYMYTSCAYAYVYITCAYVYTH
jgi:hypothetical protein